MKRVLIVGSSGLLGSSLTNYLASRYDVKTVTSSSSNSDFKVDMSNQQPCLDLLSEVDPDFIINLAAYTDVDGCESNIEKAYRINSKIAENIADYCRLNNQAFVVHISTDHFYDEEQSDENKVRIYNSYAMTKYSAELSYIPDQTTILRTNFFGRSSSSISLGLCDSIYKLACSGKELNLFNNVYFSPVSINTLCSIIELSLRKKLPGIYNVGSKKGMSKQDFLLEFLRKCGIEEIKYKSVNVELMNFPVRRPKDMRMDVTLFERKFEYILPTLIEEIESVANEYK
ncbi:sugar nucleotide-binding protein [Vibrio gigantis]|uniref:sugar nucleotide-binding protein n=1 Tax=Vibrio gigantis TaxID=296199 RepID=UPI0035A60E0E